MEKQKMIEAIRESTTAVFSTMLGLDVAHVGSYAEERSPSVHEGVMSVVSIAGDWVGSGVLSCSAAFACRLCSDLLMTSASSVNEEVLDSMGELANMIIGNFKTMAEEVVGPLALSVPTVVYGRNFTSRSPGQRVWTVLAFECEGEAFEIRVFLIPSVDASTTSFGMGHLQAV